MKKGMILPVSEMAKLEEMMAKVMLKYDKITLFPILTSC
jgi:hypothetical protein